MKKLQIAVAVGTLLAAGAVSAATISQSGVTVAREVIANDTQSIIAPTATFTYAGSLSSNANSSQDFNIVLTLGQGATWVAAKPTAGVIEFKVFDGGSYTAIPVLAAGTTAATKAAIELMDVEYVDNATAPTQLRFKFRLVNQSGVPANLSQVQVNFNVNKTAVAAATVGGVPFDAALATVGADVFAKVTKLFTVNGTVDADGAAERIADVCSDDFKRVSLNARNYTGAGVGVIGESGDAGVSNNGYILLDQALNVVLRSNKTAPSITQTPNRTTNPALENKSFATDPTGVAGTAVMPLGAINFRNLNTAAWDLDVAGKYYSLRDNLLTNAGFGDLATLGVLHTDGAVDTSSLVLKLFSTSGFASNSTITLANNPMCLNGGANVTAGALTAVSSNSGKDLTLTFNHAALATIAGGTNATLLNTVVGGTSGAYTTATTNLYYICYNVPGNTEIPQSTFSGIAQLVKELSGTTYVEQTNQSCKRDLAGLGGGVKIDVRNFLPYDPDNGFYMGIVRVINNSETTNADLIGQYIRADGKYGKWGDLGTLPARGARYFTSKEINDLLVNNSTTAGAANTDNSGSGGLTAATGQELPANTRLRISSTKASTLRVQNYIYATASGALTEVSSSQGADFVNIEASDRDHIDQDAQAGVKK